MLKQTGSALPTLGYSLRRTACTSHSNLKRNALNLIVLALCMLSSCALTPPVLEMALADSSMRMAKEIGVETKQPTLYAQAEEALQKAQFYYREKNHTQARAYAIKARQIIEKAELSVVEETGLVSEESQVVNIGLQEESSSEDPFDAF
jgi:hypothetical protein